jgi:hypothetical protein
MRGRAVPTTSHRLRVLIAALIVACLSLLVFPAMARRPGLTPLLFVAAAAAGVLLARPPPLVPVFAGLTWTAIGASEFGGVSPVELSGLALFACGCGRGDPPAGRAEALVVIALS